MRQVESESKPPEILQFFAYQHLPLHLREVSKQFSQLAEQLVGLLAPSAELSVALRKLLESKDAAVRAALLTQQMFIQED